MNDTFERLTAEAGQQLLDNGIIDLTVLVAASHAGINIDTITSAALDWAADPINSISENN